MKEPLYTTEILRLAASLGDPHSLEREDGQAELRSPTCGSRVTLAVQLDKHRRIERLLGVAHEADRGAIARVDRHARFA